MGMGKPKSTPRLPMMFTNPTTLDLERANPGVKDSVQSGHFVHLPSLEEARLALSELHGYLSNQLVAFVFAITTH